MAHTIKVEIDGEDGERLARLAAKLGKSPEETARLLVDEKLREEAFSSIEFRSSAFGRLAYVRGARLAVWEVVFVGRSYDLDPERTAAHLSWPVESVLDAFAYARVFSEEIEPLLRRAEELSFEDLERILPTIEQFP